MITAPDKSYKKGTEIYLKVWGEVQTEEASKIIITVVPDDSSGT
jgi:hypothetical protein